MPAQILAALTIGVVTGFAMGTITARTRASMVKFCLAGAIGAVVYAAYPLARGDEFLNTDPIRTVIIAGFFTGVAILFTKPK